MRDGFVKVAAATPQIRVADCKYNTDRIIELIKKCEEIKERVYKSDNMDDLASAEAAALRASKYHTGNKLVHIYQYGHR